MVASCCRFLCYFCRISRHNQRALFDHLSYLLENSSVGLGESFFSHFSGSIGDVQIKMESTVMLYNPIDLLLQFYLNIMKCVKILVCF